MYTAFKVYVHKLHTKRGETMIIYESKTKSNYLNNKHQLFIVSEIDKYKMSYKDWYRGINI